MSVIFIALSQIRANKKT